MAVFNRFENDYIQYIDLPEEWKGKEAFDCFESFLQKNWQDRKILFYDGVDSTKQQFLDFRLTKSIRTNKYVGTIAFRGSQINIYPKAFKTSIDDKSLVGIDNKFLIYNISKWIEYIAKDNYPFLNLHDISTESNDFRSLFANLFVSFLKHATKKHLYYSFENIEEETTSVKGTFDVVDYALNKIPRGKQNKFLCKYSSFQLDNKLNRIIKYTCKSIFPFTGPKNKNELRKLLKIYEEVEYKKVTYRDCNKIKINKLNKIYEPVLLLAKLLLSNKSTAFDAGKKDSFCFLFPTDFLYQEFIGGYIKNAIESENNDNRVILQNKSTRLIDSIKYNGKTGTALFTLKPDIICEIKDKKTIILDTKYKNMPRFKDSTNIKDIINDNVDIADLYQMSAYAAKKQIDDCYLLYPMYKNETLETDFPVLENVEIIDSTVKIIRIHLLRIPFVFENDPTITYKMLDKLLKTEFLS